MIHVVQNSDVYEITAPYDPTLINLIKTVPGRFWNATTKTWTIPSKNLGWFLKLVEDTIYANQVKVISNEDIAESTDLVLNSTIIPDIDISDIDQYVADGYTLYKHQIDFLKYAKYRHDHQFVLGDDMGLGKTIQTMNLALYRRKAFGCKRCLIICNVNTSKYNWVDDIQKHTNGQESAYILGTRVGRNGKVRYDGGAAKLGDLITLHMHSDNNCTELPYFIILNVEALRAKSGHKYALADTITQLVNSGEIGMIAIDEVHTGMSPQSAQGKIILEIKKQTKNNAFWLPMTGTPIINKPVDLFVPLKLVDAHTFKDYYTWCMYFVLYGGFGNHDIVGYKHIPELKQMLQNNMIRRLKTEAIDLPPKIQIIEYVELTATQQTMYNNIQDALRQQHPPGDIAGTPINALTTFIELRQVSGSPELIDNTIVIDDKYGSVNAKFKRLMELLEIIHARGEKVLVFSNWVQPLKTLYKFVSSKYKTCCFTGTMSEEARQKHKRVFINNPEYTVMLGTIGAMGTTHTFTVATNVIFFEEPWNDAVKQQCEDRCNRIGSTAPLNVYTLIAKDTVDDVVHKIITDKKDMFDYIVGNKDLRHNPVLLKLLLGD